MRKLKYAKLLQVLASKQPRYASNLRLEGWRLTLRKSSGMALRNRRWLSSSSFPFKSRLEPTATAPVCGSWLQIVYLWLPSNPFLHVTFDDLTKFLSQCNQSLLFATAALITKHIVYFDNEINEVLGQKASAVRSCLHQKPMESIQLALFKRHASK